MDLNSFEIILKTHLSLIEERLDEAAGIAKAAMTCVEAGNVEKAVEITLDVEQLIYEAGTLLNAASLINRIARS